MFSNAIGSARDVYFVTNCFSGIIVLVMHFVFTETIKGISQIVSVANHHKINTALRNGFRRVHKGSMQRPSLYTEGHRSYEKRTMARPPGSGTNTRQSNTSAAGAGEHER